MEKCDNCGYQNNTTDDYCANCGTYIGVENPSPPLEGPPKTTKSVIGDFFYLIYCMSIMIIAGVVMAILYLFFGFWIDVIYFIIALIVIFGCMSQVFVAVIDWAQEKRELKKKANLKQNKNDEIITKVEK